MDGPLLQESRDTEGDVFGDVQEGCFGTLVIFLYLISSFMIGTYLLFS